VKKPLTSNSNRQGHNSFHCCENRYCLPSEAPSRECRKEKDSPRGAISTV
jgi:hypothetical protein